MQTNMWRLYIIILQNIVTVTFNLPYQSSIFSNTSQFLNQVTFDFASFLHHQCVLINKFLITSWCRKLAVERCVLQSVHIHASNRHKSSLLVTQPSMRGPQRRPQRGRVCQEQCHHLESKVQFTKVESIRSRSLSLNQKYRTAVFFLSSFFLFSYLIIYTILYYQKLHGSLPGL